MPRAGQVIRPRGKVLLVGESNPYGGDDYYALYPHPEGCSGWRLCRLILGMRRADYLRAFERVNLCQGPWLAVAAGVRAGELRHRRLILCGAKVCSAFGVPYTPLCRTAALPYEAPLVALVLPHPSGRCRFWNVARAFERTRAAIAEFAPELATLLGAADINGEPPDGESGGGCG